MSRERRRWGWWRAKGRDPDASRVIAPRGRWCSVGTPLPTARPRRGDTINARLRPPAQLRVAVADHPIGADLAVRTLQAAVEDAARPRRRAGGRRRTLGARPRRQRQVVQAGERATTLHAGRVRVTARVTRGAHGLVAAAIGFGAAGAGAARAGAARARGSSRAPAARVAGASAS